jgi:hypothetical protein
MRVLVCGGRDFDNPALMDSALSKTGASLIITGAQRTFSKEKGKWIGADWQAIEWALRNEVPFLGYPARWTKEGRAAGPIRNQRMIDKCKPELVASLPGGRGTADMVRRAREAGITVREF